MITVKLSQDDNMFNQLLINDVLIFYLIFHFSFRHYSIRRLRNRCFMLPKRQKLNYNKGFKILMMKEMTTKKNLQKSSKPILTGASDVK